MIKILLSILLITSQLFAAPEWFENRTVEAPLFSTIGYGVGQSMKEAKLEARVDISAQISSNISSSTSIITSQKNSKVSIEAEDKTLSTSQTVLKNSKILKSQRVDNRYFVAIAHQKIPTLPCITKQNPFLSNIDLIQEANKITPCLYEYGLQRINNQWHIYSSSFTQELNYFEFDSFFTSMYSSSLKISSKKSAYRADDIFTLEVQSINDGYLTIIAVYENGKVGVMLRNTPIRKNSIVKFPNKEDGFELVAGLNEKNQATKDLYFAFVTKESINLANFETISDKLLNEKEYRFNKVIKLCDKYNFSTILIRTLKNH